jgi:hypothetical protein
MDEEQLDNLDQRLLGGRGDGADLRDSQLQSLFRDQLPGRHSALPDFRAQCRRGQGMPGAS